MTNCQPPFLKELEQVSVQSFGDGLGGGGEAVTRRSGDTPRGSALDTVTNARNIATSLPTDWGGCSYVR